MPTVKYLIELSDSERKNLEDIVTKGNTSARKILRANILLASDKNAIRRMTVAEIAEVYHTTPTTVQTVRTEYSQKGMESTINRKTRETPPVAPKVTGDVEAHIIALCCSMPPEGYSRWTVRLLADKSVELGYVDSINYSTISRTLKKTNLSLT